MDDLLKDLFLALGMGFVGGLLLSPGVAHLGRRMGVMDFPEEGRRIHANGTPRTGGLAILLAFMLSALLLLGSASFSKYLIIGKVHQLRTILLGISIVVGIGVYDDFFGTSAIKKLIPEVLLGALVYSGGLRIENLSLPFGYYMELGPFSFIMTILWVVAVMNAINLIDGMDGLCVGISMLALTSFAVMGFHKGLLIEGALTSLLIAASLGFLRYNVSPARIFLGDTGSLLLGFSIATFSIWNLQDKREGFVVILPLACLIVPIFDTMLAVLRRTLRGTSIFAPDIEHIHHQILKFGISNCQAVRLLLVVSGVGCILGFAVTFGGAYTSRVGSVLLALLFTFLLAMYLVSAKRKTPSSST